MLNKWMIAAVTAALFSGADWYAASRVISPRTAAPAATAPAATAPASAMPSMSMPTTSVPAPSGSAASGTATGGTGTPAGTTTVSISNFAFAPASVTVRAGATVTWLNRDEEPHTVTAQDKAFGSATLNTGQSYSHRFTTPGTYPYLCTIHPFMTAVVVVTP